VSSITHFRTELRVKVDAIEAELKSLELQMSHDVAGSEQLVRAYLEHLSRQLKRTFPLRSFATSILKLSSEMATAAEGGEGSRRVDPQELTDAYNRAWAAMDIVATAIDEAACAALEAWLAEEHAAKAKAAESGRRAETKDDK
jgi:hypothetical protein